MSLYNKILMREKGGIICGEEAGINCGSDGGFYRSRTRIGVPKRKYTVPKFERSKEQYTKTMSNTYQRTPEQIEEMWTEEERNPKLINLKKLQSYERYEKYNLPYKNKRGKIPEKLKPWLYFVNEAKTGNIQGLQRKNKEAYKNYLHRLSNAFQEYQ